MKPALLAILLLCSCCKEPDPPAPDIECGIVEGAVRSYYTGASYYVVYNPDFTYLAVPFEQWSLSVIGQEYCGPVGAYYPNNP
jgi:hypothetical protein